jgi:hypothetical protein
MGARGVAAAKHCDSQIDDGLSFCRINFEADLENRSKRLVGT